MSMGRGIYTPDKLSHRSYPFRLPFYIIGARPNGLHPEIIISTNSQEDENWNQLEMKYGFDELSSTSDTDFKKINVVCVRRQVSTAPSGFGPFIKVLCILGFLHFSISSHFQMHRPFSSFVSQSMTSRTFTRPLPAPSMARLRGPHKPPEFSF